MPANAYATGCIDFKLPLEDVGPAIARLVLASGTDEPGDTR